MQCYEPGGSEAGDDKHFLMTAIGANQEEMPINIKTKSIFVIRYLF